MPSQHSANIKIGTDFLVGEMAVVYFSYKLLWDKGSRLDLLVFDPDCALHKALEGMPGSPTPPIEFQLEYEPSRKRDFKNIGTKHRLYLLTAGQVVTPMGLCIRIRAVDKASVILREAVTNHSANGVKASQFLEGMLQKYGIDVLIPSTGDVAGPHRALRVKPIEAIRYELDRVLSASGKPISIQYDDRIDKQRLQGYEELYDAKTQLLVSMTGGSYTWGVATPGNNGKPAAYGNAAYHFEMDQDYRPAIWGHQVSIDHLNIKGDNVTGEVKARLASKLGIQGDALTQGGSRISMPMVNSDSPTSDDYYANATMVNSVFQTEMSVTKGSVMVDADYKTFDSPDILNRNHVTLSITGGTNAPSNNAIIPKKAVVMGYEHRLNRKSAFTRILVRRGG